MNDDGTFDDLLAANKRYARSAPREFDGIAHQGVMILTCMDSRIEPLEMVGLMIGEAKILRTAGARLTDRGLGAFIMGVHKLKVNRILLVPHTKCAAASMDEVGMRAAIKDASGIDPGDFEFGVSPDQLGNLRADCERLRSHPLIAGFAEVGGFLYDVETGLMSREC